MNESSGEVTDAFIKDVNKYHLIRKKSRAGEYMAQARAFPSLYNTQLAYATLSDFVNFMTAEKPDHTKKLNNARKKMSDIMHILHGDQNNPKTQECYAKYKVRPKQENKGRFVYTKFQNLPNLVMVMDKIFTDMIDLAQELGFGSVKPFKRTFGMQKLFEETGVTEDDMNGD